MQSKQQKHTNTREKNATFFLSPLTAAGDDAPAVLPAAPPDPLALPRRRDVDKPLGLPAAAVGGRNVSAPAVPATGLDALASAGAYAP